MGYSNTEKTVLSLAAPIAESFGLSVWDVEFKKEGSEYYLRVFLDKEGGVAIDDCEQVSRALSDKLDEFDPIEQAYILEVCSAGIDRELKRESDFLAFLGHDVDVKLYAPLDGKKEFSAELLNFCDDEILLSLDGKEIKIPFSKAASVRLSVKF